MIHILEVSFFLKKKKKVKYKVQTRTSVKHNLFQLCTFNVQHLLSSNTLSHFMLRKPELSTGPTGHLGLYKGFTTLLFLSVNRIKIAHLFFQPSSARSSNYGTTLTQMLNKTHERHQENILILKLY